MNSARRRTVLMSITISWESGISVLLSVFLRLDGTIGPCDPQAVPKHEAAAAEAVRSGLKFAPIRTNRKFVKFSESDCRYNQHVGSAAMECG